MRRIDRAELSHRLAVKLTLAPKACRRSEQMATERARAELLEALLDAVFAGNAVLIAPDPVADHGAAMEAVGVCTVRYRPGIWDRDEPHPCPDRPPPPPPLRD